MGLVDKNATFQTEQKGYRLCTFKCEDEGVYQNVNDRSPRHEERAQDAPLSSVCNEGLKKMPCVFCLWDLHLHAFICLSIQYLGFLNHLQNSECYRKKPFIIMKRNETSLNKLVRSAEHFIFYHRILAFL